MAKTFKTADVIRQVGICFNTLYNWFTSGKIPEVTKDRNGRRIFTEEDIRRIKAYKEKVIHPSKH